MQRFRSARSRLLFVGLAIFIVSTLPLYTMFYANHPVNSKQHDTKSVLTTELMPTAVPATDVNGSPSTTTQQTAQASAPAGSPKTMGASLVAREAKFNVSPEDLRKDTFAFKPFPGVEFVANREASRSISEEELLPTGYSVFSGNLTSPEGLESGTVNLVVSPNGGINGRVVISSGELFYISHDLDGSPIVREINSAEFAECGGEPATHPEDMEAPQPKLQAALSEQSSNMPILGADTTTNERTASADAPPTAQDTPGVIDVLVAYSSQSVSRAGGQSALDALIANSISTSNTAYANSQITGRLRLAHAAQVSYTDSGNLTTDLTRAATPSDGYLDTLQTLRDTYKADVVVYLSTSTNYCGLAYTLTSLSSSLKSWMFATVSLDCAVGNLSFAHEVGHNLGADHDRANSAGAGLRSYSFGYNQGSWRTVMSYGTSTRISYFSNPSVTYNGTPTGISNSSASSANNADTLNESMPFVANFYSSTYTLSGTILVGSSPLSGVTISAGALGTTTTNSSGVYSFNNLAPNTTYTLTPSLSGYSFSPSSASGTLTGNTTKNFTATLVLYTISGTVTASGVGLGSVTINGGSLGSTTTNSSGAYSFANVSAGLSYTLTPSKTGYTFSPSSISNTTTGNTTHNFTALGNTFTISGKVTLNGTGLAGVTVTSSSLGSRTTDSSGNYSFSAPQGTIYSLTLSKTGYSFSPASASGTLSGNATHNFSATLNTYTITGHITGDSSALGGVSINAGPLGSASSNSSGDFSFTNVPYGTIYTLTPSKTGHTFSPASISATITGHASASFAISTKNYSISGSITFNGSALSGVTITGGAVGSTTTNTSGNFTLANIPHGTSYTITPTKAGYNFAPTSIQGNLTGNVSTTFQAQLTKYTISGHVTSSGTGSLSGVTIGAGNLGSALTDSLGNFTLPNITYGSAYTLTPVKTGYTFSPSSVSGTVTGNTTVRLNGATQTYTLSGNVMLNGLALKNIGISAGVLGSTTTNDTGVFTFSSIAAGTFYSLTPQATGYLFTPAAFIGTLYKNTTTLSFAASCASGYEPYGALCRLIPDQDQDGLSDAQEAALGTNPANADTDNDDVRDGQEVLDGTNPLDRGSCLRVLGKNLCSEWNGFLSPMANILENVNLSSGTLSVSTTLYDIAGNAQSTSRMSLASGQQVDLGVHDMIGWTANSVGRVCSSQTGKAGDLDGAMIYYKWKSGSTSLAPEDMQFAFAMPRQEGIKGEQAVSYNTYQPSSAPEDAGKLVANWIQITNLSTSAQTGTLNFYRQNGTLLSSKQYKVAANARVDIAAHNLGTNLVGLAIWKPRLTTTSFMVRNVRYLYDNLQAENSFFSAFQLEGTAGSGEELAVPLDPRQGSAIVEILNTLGSSVTVTLQVYRQTGEWIDAKTVKLAAHASYHYISDPVLQGNPGIALIKGSKIGSIAAVAMHYGRAANGAVRSLYGVRAMEPMGTVLHGSYNTFLGQGCLAQLVNTSTQAQTLSVTLKRPSDTQGGIKTLTSADALVIPPKGFASIDACSSDTANVYGQITVQGMQPNTIVGTVVRIGKDSRYRFTTPLRQ